MIGEQRTTGAALNPVRTEHEVVDEQLAAAGEEIGERFFPVRAVENVGLLDFFPGKFAALLAEFVAESCELLFLFQECASGCHPVVVWYDFRAYCCACCQLRFSSQRTFVASAWSKRPKRLVRSRLGFYLAGRAYGGVRSKALPFAQLVGRNR